MNRRLFTTRSPSSNSLGHLTLICIICSADVALVSPSMLTTHLPLVLSSSPVTLVQFACWLTWIRGNTKVTTSYFSHFHTNIKQIHPNHICANVNHHHHHHQHDLVSFSIVITICVLLASSLIHYHTNQADCESVKSNKRKN